jgi:pimeloyl-ACP methyl ester carboxylesterase
MNIILDAARSGRTAPTRVVMLPAAFTEPQDFVRAGFGTAVRARGLDLDVMFVGCDLRHVTDRSVLELLYLELVQPARAQGCAVWLGGISLGGYLALSFAERHGPALAGLCLFAPYLGSHIVTDEVARGGLEHWTAGDVAADDEERRVWRFIKTLRAGDLPVYLGLGRDDRFAARHRLLAAALAAPSVHTVAGGHEWPTWRTLWDNFLDAQFAAAAPRP